MALLLIGSAWMVVSIACASGYAAALRATSFRVYAVRHALNSCHVASGVRCGFVAERRNATGEALCLGAGHKYLCTLSLPLAQSSRELA